MITAFSNLISNPDYAIHKYHMDTVYIDYHNCHIIVCNPPVTCGVHGLPNGYSHGRPCEYTSKWAFTLLSLTTQDDNFDDE